MPHRELSTHFSEHELGMPLFLPKRKPSPVGEILGDGKGQLNFVIDYLGTGQDSEPLEVFYTDFSKLSYAEGTRKAHLMAAVDECSECMRGCTVEPSANRQLALRCWKRMHIRWPSSVNRWKEAILHSDLDSINTSHDWLRRVLLNNGLRVSCSERRAKDNPWIKSIWGRTKTEVGLRIVEAHTLSDLEGVIDERFRYYNHWRRHSKIGNRAQ
jgi:transposase InsO family protein